MSKRRRGAKRKEAERREALNNPAPVDQETAPDWSGKCENCGASPIVPVTGLCGPCTFGEADTAGGNW